MRSLPGSRSHTPLGERLNRASWGIGSGGLIKVGSIRCLCGKLVRRRIKERPIYIRSEATKFDNVMSGCLRSNAVRKPAVATFAFLENFKIGGRNRNGNLRLPTNVVGGFSSIRLSSSEEHRRGA